VQTAGRAWALPAVFFRHIKDELGSVHMRVLVMTLLFATLLLPAGQASAQALPTRVAIDELLRATASGISLDEAVSMVERRYKARVVRAEVEQEKGKTVYVLRLFNEGSGRVWTVRVDAASGSML
jgi:hypothetical protein